MNLTQLTEFLANILYQIYFYSNEDQSDLSKLGQSLKSDPRYNYSFQMEAFLWLADLILKISLWLEQLCPKLELNPWLLSRKLF